MVKDHLVKLPDNPGDIVELSNKEHVGTRVCSIARKGEHT